LPPAEQIRRDVAVDGREQNAREARDRAGEDETQELVGVGVDPERADALLVPADRTAPIST